jgi:hypothetical protein
MQNPRRRAPNQLGHHGRRCAVLVAACCLDAASGAGATAIERAELHFANGSYRYLFSASLAADAQSVRAVVSDFERLGRLNDDIVVSRVIERYSDTRLKRQLLLKQCLLVFCFDINFIELVDILPNGDIETRIVPEESSFHRGTAVWRIVAVDATHTRVTLEADQAPRFFIPPIIGPLVIKSTFLREVTETLQKLESTAGAPAP